MTAVHQKTLPFEAVADSPPSASGGGAALDRFRPYANRDIQAYNMFDAAYPSPDNIKHWGHLRPETPEDITDPLTLERLRITSLYEILNDDSLNGMINVGAESKIGTGPRVDVQCGFDYGKERKLEQTIEYLWNDWFEKVCYAQKLRTAAKDFQQFGVYYRRIVENPRMPFGLGVVLVSPMRIGNPDSIENNDYAVLDGETMRVVNGIAFDMYGNERFYCVLDKPLFSSWYDRSQYSWVSVDTMARIFDPQFSEQIDGIPMTTPSLEKGVLRRQYEMEELSAARKGASWSGSIQTKSDFKAIFESLKPTERERFLEAISSQYSSDNLGSSIRWPVRDVVNLPPFTEAVPFNAQHPHPGFSAHRHESLKGQGRSLRMPENIATGSSAPYNYASVQKDSQHWANHRECNRQDIELFDLKKTFDIFVQRASAFDDKLRRVFTRQVFPVIPHFFWKQEEHADPVKQVNAWEKLNRLGAMSIDDIIMALGKDPERQKLIVKRGADEMKGYVIHDQGLTVPVSEDDDPNKNEYDYHDRRK